MQLYHGEFQLLFNIMIMPYFVLEEAVVVDHIASRFTTTCAISAYRYTSCEFESRSWPGAFDTTLCDLRQIGGFLRVLWFLLPIKLTATI